MRAKMTDIFITYFLHFITYIYIYGISENEKVSKSNLYIT